MPSSTVKPARAKKFIFSIESKLVQTVDYKIFHPLSGAHGRLAIIEGTRFWARVDPTDEGGKHLGINVLRPIGHSGDINYSRVTESFKLARSTWKDARKTHDGTLEILADKKRGR